MADDINKLAMETEKMSLLPNRFYLVLRPTSDGKGFDVTAYDTTDPKKPIPSAFFVLKGIMETLDTFRRISTERAISCNG